MRPRKPVCLLPHVHQPRPAPFADAQAHGNRPARCLLHERGCEQAHRLARAPGDFRRFGFFVHLEDRQQDGLVPQRCADLFTTRRGEDRRVFRYLERTVLARQRHRHRLDQE